MCLLLETIKIENGEIQNLEYHNRRFNASRLEKFRIARSGVAEAIDQEKTGSNAVDHRAPDFDEVDLGSIISIPTDLDSGIFRCRVLYSREIEKIEFIPHKELIIRSLKLVYSDDIDYSVKYADRDLLMSLFELRGDCDEILIVKNGFITDTSISNIVFRRPDGSWITPDTPLLKGTMRMHLLDIGRISEEPVRIGDLGNYTCARMINCMMDLDSGPPIEMNRIFN